ncbi:MAG: SDR family NAD(P)-dependent oxidoreductase, partial [Mycobacterium sp.]
MTSRTAVVVGAASGIGRAVAHALAADNCLVTVADRNTDGAHSVAAELGDPHSAATVEVTDEDSVRALFDHAGALDVVVNTAGYGGVGLITELPVEDFRSVVDVCLTGSFLVIKHAAPRLRDGGALVSISSLNARQPAAAMSAYCAAKIGWQIACPLLPFTVALTCLDTVVSRPNSSVAQHISRSTSYSVGVNSYRPTTSRHNARPRGPTSFGGRFGVSMGAIVRAETCCYTPSLV